jgi:hypothetical protein
VDEARQRLDELLAETRFLYVRPGTAEWYQRREGRKELNDLDAHPVVLRTREKLAREYNLVFTGTGAGNEGKADRNLEEDGRQREVVLGILPGQFANHVYGARLR